ncbi:hypothetical protein [Sporosarcina sp. NPDC096371]|uniref:hypothetical protein n=1 Tax=Sporosarcina sp. NPDC096371 TaxID=3364530 RepID=UPI00382363ED
MSIRRLSFFTIVLTFGFMVMGGFVAASSSGTACGSEWPLCNGKLIPPLEGDALIVFLYRAMGVVQGVMTVMLVVNVKRAKVSATIRKVANWMMSLFVVQMLLGAASVWFEVHTFVVAVHAILAMLYLACVLVIWSQSVRFHYFSLNYEQHKMISRHLTVFLGLVLLTLFVEAYVRHGLMEGTSSQPLQTVLTLLWIISAGYSLVLTNWSYAKDWGAGLQKRFKFVSLTVILQGLFGLLSMKTSDGIGWILFHVAVGIVLFALVVEARLFMSAIVIKKGKLILFSTKQISSKKTGKTRKYLGQP